MNALDINNLTVSYDNHIALSNINLKIEKSKLVGIIGPNGAGKSTLMKAILGLIPKDYGKIAIYDQKVSEMRRQIAYVPQRNNIDWDFPINVLDTVLLGTYPKLGIFRRITKKDKESALNCLEQVGLSEYKKRQIGELSGGQQQRVFLARALAQDAELFFLDEPFVGIDVSSEKTIISILKQLRDEGKTVVVVHHDLSKAEEYFDDLILINKELVKSGAVKSVLQPEVIKSAYRSQLPLMQQVGVGV